MDLKKKASVNFITLTYEDESITTHDKDDESE